MAFATDESVWDEFLTAWPLERLATMTLDEYTKAGDRDTFTYWIEHRVNEYGSIRGAGSAFKFGVYARGDAKPKKDHPPHVYDDRYGWNQHFGATPDAAFRNVRAHVAAVAGAARAADLKAIDDSPLNAVYRWKIAFHYQDRAHPCVVGVFKRETLLSYAGLPLNDRETPFHELQQRAMLRRPENRSIIDFTADVWRAWLGSHPLRVTLTDGAIGNGYLAFKLADAPFPESMHGDESGSEPGEAVRFSTDTGESFDSDIRVSGSSARLRRRLGSYFRAIGAKPGDVIEISANDAGGYAIACAPKDKAPAGAINTAVPAGGGVQEPTSERTMQPTNKILCGPPGTGKTYRTVNEALAILDPPFLDSHKDERPQLKRRFDELAEAGRIRFITFHQSFSYEDFVEGIRASAEEDGGPIRYEVEDGVFKEMCDAARSRAVEESDGAIDLAGRRIWKMSLGEAVTEADIYEDCIANNYVLLGFGADLDYAGVRSATDIRQRLTNSGEDVKPNDFGVSAIDRLARGMKIGDLVVVSKGNLKFRAIGEITGDYQHIDRGGADTYSQSRAVRWLRRYDPAQPYTAVMKNKFSQMSIYELHPGSIDLELLAALLVPKSVRAADPGQYVLIIDEINRGNVSRIFGELITLIEPSRRAGESEALEVTLPYSKEPFSVPSNVHLIGTMNTADRSLTGLDVALRRRFEFVEVMPRPELLDGITVEGVNLRALLRAMNRRIEVLMGRDYMLGHAYFLGLHDTPGIAALASVFRDRVVPLLQEYFYADWQKIAWVLNDHRKPKNLQFVQKADAAAEDLFGQDVELPASAADVWHVNEAAFSNPDAYRGTIEAEAASGDA